jgi:hypothetical protein
MGGEPIKGPMVSISTALNGKGYWMVTTAGVVYPFGSAKSYGEPYPSALTSPITGIARSVNGNGYWIAEADGVILNYGDAEAFTQIGQKLNSPVVAMSPMH